MQAQLQKSEFILEPISGTDDFNAYRVVKNSQGLGLIFHNKYGFPVKWSCGDGKKYDNSEDCIVAMLAITGVK